MKQKVYGMFRLWTDSDLTRRLAVQFMPGCDSGRRPEVYVVADGTTPEIRFKMKLVRGINSDEAETHVAIHSWMRSHIAVLEDPYSQQLPRAGDCSRETE